MRPQAPILPALTLTLTGLAVLLGNSSVAAKMYKCTDAKGAVSYSQSYDPKRCTGGGAQLDAQGLPIKTMQRQKTAEEIAADKAEAARLAKAKEIADHQATLDNALTSSYVTEAELLRARDQELEVIEANTATSRLSLASQEKSLAEILAHAASFERAKKPVPQTTTDQLKLVRHQIEMTTKQIAQRETEKSKLRAEFEIKLQRYRELKARVDAQRNGL